MNRKNVLIFSIFVLFLSAKLDADTPLKVAVYDSPPFGMKIGNGTLSGLSVECWIDIAERLGYDYELILTDMDDLLGGVQEGRYDVAVGAITITPFREDMVDFSYPVNPSGTGIAVSTRHDKHPFWSVWELVLVNLVEMIGGLILLLIFFGIVIWLIEKHKNPEQFNSGLSGIIDGIWWAAVTMTTVGYGDKSPKSKLGRFIAMMWMFTSIILISLFTASTSSILTANKIETSIENREDLRRVRVGAAEHSSGEEYLIRSGIDYMPYPDIEEAMTALQNDDLDAVVSNVPVVRYLINTKYKRGIRIGARLLAENYMGMALGNDSPLLEEINMELLKKTAEENWKNTITKYLGEE